jgi:predicted transcriptional regulator
MSEPTKELALPLEAPNPGELDVLGVLWIERQGENRPLQLSEVYRRVCERRRQFGEPEPALTTVSTHLRGLTGKKLVEEVAAARAQAVRQPIRTRGGYTPATRSPLTSYRAAYRPGEVLHTTFQGLASAYPPGQRGDALVDFARALGFGEATLRKLEQFVAEEREAENRPAGS